MPDLLNRDRIETIIAGQLASLQAEQRHRLEDLLGDPPDVSRLTASVWKSIEDETAAALAVLLLPVFEHSHFTLAGILGSPQEAGASREAATVWAASHARTLAADMTVNTRDQILATLADESTKEKLAVAGGLTLILMPILGPARAEGVAVTEITRSVSAGEQAAAARFNAGLIGRGQLVGVDGLPIGTTPGRTAVALWVAELDSRTCPICLSLDGTGREMWGDEFPDGPPAHPKCRCFLRWKVV